jgi:3-phenylpropionate/trans-cinnamate dioxygenase ferredoxin subunit
MADWVKVAAKDDIPPQGLRVVVGDEEILLVKCGGEVFAMAYLCSHQDMELEGGHEEEGGWVCPHHGARFDLRTGEAVAMPAAEPVSVYEVKVEGGSVFVREPAP